MAHGPLSGLPGQLRRLAGGRPAEEDSDARLLEQFVRRREEAAFVRLIERHGPLVLGVCRRVLGHAQDAEDAFQATFLVLSRKAAAVRRPEALGGWLYEVAYHVATRARAAAARRRLRERQTEPMSPDDPLSAAAAREVRAVLDEELHRLPEKYRTPLVLCYLQGQTNAEAARQLGWTKGTVSGRLARARELLKSRLARRGLALSAGLFLPALADGAVKPAVPAALTQATARAAVLYAARNAAAGATVSAPVAALTEGVLQTMLWTKLKSVLAVVVALGLLGTGVGLGARHLLRAGPTGAKLARPQTLAHAPDPKAAGQRPARPVDGPLGTALEEARKVKDPNLRSLALQEIAKTRFRAGDKQGAAETAREAAAAAGEIAGDRRAFCVTWAGLVQQEIGDRAGARRSFRESLRLAGKIKNLDDRINALNNIGYRLKEVHNPEGVRQAFRLAVEAAQAIPNAEDRQSRMSWVVLGLARAGEAREALRLVGSVPDNGLRGQCLAEIAGNQAWWGDVKGALKTAELIAGTNDVQGFMADMAREGIVRAQAQKGDVKGALETAAGIRENSHKATALTYVIPAQARKDRAGALKTVRDALQAAQACQAGIIRDSRLAGVAGAQAEAGDVKGAAETARLIQDDGYRGMVRAKITRARAKTGSKKATLRQLRQALEALNQAQARPTENPSIQQQNQSIGRFELLNGLLEARLFAEAWDVARGTSDEQEAALLLRNVARRATEAGQGRAAGRWAGKLSSPYARAMALAGVANGLLKHGGGK